MFNKTVNDTSYSSNKNEKNFLQSVLSPIKICINNRKAEVNEFKNSYKAESHYLKEYKLDILFSFVVTVLIAGFILKLFDYIAHFYLSCPIVKIVVLLAAFVVLLLAFYVNLILKKCYLHGFIISFLTYICSIAYMDVLNDIIQQIHIVGDFIAILAVVIYFAITCSFIYRSFQLVLKENTKLIFPVIALFVFFAILDNSNWEIVVLAVAVVTFVLEPKNLNILFKKVFHKKIKCGKKTLVVLRICVLLLQVLVYLSMELSRLLGKFVENCAYTCIPDGWLAFFRILIFVVLSTVMMHLLKTKKDKICCSLEKIIDSVDKYCKIGAEEQLDQSVSNCSQNENTSKEVQVSDMNNDLKVNNEN